jgi:uncharacterized protein YbaR (Trm112 family)
MTLPKDQAGAERRTLRGGGLKKELMEILACPVCKGELELRVETEEGDEVIKGSLLCAGCDEAYPIDDAIPNLLPPEMRAQS